MWAACEPRWASERQCVGLAVRQLMLCLEAHTVSLARSARSSRAPVSLLLWPVRRVARCPFVAVSWHSRTLVTLSRLSLLPTSLPVHLVVVTTNITVIITPLSGPIASHRLVRSRRHLRTPPASNSDHQKAERGKRATTEPRQLPSSRLADSTQLYIALG